MDKKNKQILQLLANNSRLSWQDLGKQIHLTGQAVAARVRQLEDDGSIKSYTIRQGNVQTHLVTVFMNDSRFSEFEEFLKAHKNIEQALKTSGEGCYHLVVIVEDTKQLEQFLNSLQAFARYRVGSVIKTIK